MARPAEIKQFQAGADNGSMSMRSATARPREAGTRPTCYVTSADGRVHTAASAMPPTEATKALKLALQLMMRPHDVAKVSNGRLTRTTHRFNGPRI